MRHPTQQARIGVSQESTIEVLLDVDATVPSHLGAKIRIVGQHEQCCSQRLRIFWSYNNRTRRLEDAGGLTPHLTHHCLPGSEVLEHLRRDEGGKQGYVAQRYQTHVGGGDNRWHTFAWEAREHRDIGGT